MHADELEVDASLVCRLLEAQLPEWADLPVERVRSDGTDNAIFRLGEDMAVRLPRYPGAAAQSEKEARWLPRLAPRLPLDVPVPLAAGVPGEGYPWPWLVARWLPGEVATAAPVADYLEAAVELAGFVAALRALDPAGGPGPGGHNFGRGAPLATRDEEVQGALARLHGDVDVAAAAKAWQRSLEADAWDAPPVWIHGDLHGGNLLVAGGRLSGVVDFGGLGVGDPACDTMPAWTFFPAEAREVFRSELEVDDATWERGRGWVLSMGLMAVPYYRDTNPPLAANARRWIEEALSDRGR
jgi:aminoglycoside phosphotransferase (APT) family kinase protein